MSGDVKLEPCPHCGSDSCRVIGGPGTRGGPKYWAGCDHCSGRAWGDTQGEAIAAWNRRSSSAAERAVVEALEKAEAIVVGYAESQEAVLRDLDDKTSLDAQLFAAQAKAYRRIAKRIAALSSVRGEGGDKQATRASGPTAPTDRLQSKE